MVDTSVKIFRSTDSGATALSGTAGTLIAVLDACLASGYGSVTINSLVVSGGVATCTVSTGHGFSMIGETGPVIVIAGASPAALNGQWRVASVPSTTVFTFAVAGVSDQTASGTITAKRAPAGWTKSYSGTNKAAYSRTQLGATTALLRVDDSGTTHARLVGYESMSDIDTGTGPFPTTAQVSGGLYLIKSTNSGSTARPWFLIADGKTLYFYVAPTSEAYAAGTIFGDILSWAGVDGYNCMIQSSYQQVADAGYNLHNYVSSAALGGHYLARGVSQTGASIQVGKRASFSPTNQSISGKSDLTYPNSAGNSLLTSSCMIVEGTSIRGELRGWRNLAQNLPLSHTATADDSGRTLFVLANSDSYLTAAGRIALDITGPWS